MEDVLSPDPAVEVVMSSIQLARKDDVVLIQKFAFYGFLKLLVEQKYHLFLKLCEVPGTLEHPLILKLFFSRPAAPNLPRPHTDFPGLSLRVCGLVFA